MPVTDKKIVAAYLPLPLYDRLKAAAKADNRTVSGMICKMVEDGLPRFSDTYCSQCGAEFGPGNHGFSACHEHKK